MSGWYYVVDDDMTMAITPRAASTSLRAYFEKCECKRIDTPRPGDWVVAYMRHPWERIVSAWQRKQLAPFVDWVRDNCTTDDHVRPQVEVHVGRVDAWLPFEELAELGIQHLNRTQDRPDPLYDDEFVTWYQERYSEDIEIYADICELSVH